MSTLIVGFGYLGRRVGHRLRERGETVFATTRSPSKAAKMKAEGYEPVVLDVTRDETLDAVPKVDRAVFCVGFDRASGTTFGEVHEGGMSRLLRRLDRVRWFVYTSSTGVYGGTGGVWVDEEAAPAPASASSRACVQAELILRDWAREHPGTTNTVLRLAGLYGPGRIIRRDPLRRGEPVPGDPEKHVNLIQVEDAASAVVAALERGGPGFSTFNVADNQPPTRRQLYGLTARLTGAPEPTFEARAGDEEPDRRVSNWRVKRELGLRLIYPEIVVGLPASLAAEGRS